MLTIGLTGRLILLAVLVASLVVVVRRHRPPWEIIVVAIATALLTLAVALELVR